MKIPELKSRPSNGHKGTFGKLAIFAGSTGMAGAAVLTAKGALRSGAGLVRVCVPQDIYNVVAAQLTCPLVHPLTSTGEGTFSSSSLRKARDVLEESDAAAIGPGFGRHSEAKEFLHSVLKTIRIPFVLDADGLNLIHKELELLENCSAEYVLTPHPGEFSRLTGKSVSEIQSNREASASEFSKHHKCTLVLKGSGTVVANGGDTHVNTTGNSGMATGGTGDVLTGMISSLLGQGYKPTESALLGVYLHGLAGDLAAEDLSPEALIATDLIDYIPRAILKHRASK